MNCTKGPGICSERDLFCMFLTIVYKMVLKNSHGQYQFESTSVSFMNLLRQDIIRMILFKHDGISDGILVYTERLPCFNMEYIFEMLIKKKTISYSPYSILTFS